LLFSKTTLPQIFLFFLCLISPSLAAVFLSFHLALFAAPQFRFMVNAKFFINFFLFFTIATLLLSNGRREKLLSVKSVKSGRFGKVGVASLRGPHG
jgi:hypothetical protein